MSNEWDFYFANVNDTIASLFVDLGLRDSVPDPSQPWLLWVWVDFRQPREDGLSSSQEAPVLGSIEDALTKAAEESLGADLVGRVTTAGRREFYFYGPQPDRFEEVVARVLRGFPGYEFEAGSQEDPEWTQYVKVLYPSPAEYQRIQNRHVVEALRERGDALTEARAISHWAYFRCVPDRNRFIAKAVGAGFRVTQQTEDDAAGDEYPYGATLERVDHVDWDSINEVTSLLMQFAEESAGNYDGWETSVESDNKPLQPQDPSSLMKPQDNKPFKIPGDQIRRLVPSAGSCLASDRITVDGAPVGYMYREQPDEDVDSGWRFFAGDESQEYADTPDKFAIYDVNTICNYDPAIIPFLDAPYGSAFARVPGTDLFEPEEFAGEPQASGAPKVPPIPRPRSSRPRHASAPQQVPLAERHNCPARQAGST